jgi:hypothetical protein
LFYKAFHDITWVIPTVSADSIKDFPLSDLSEDSKFISVSHEMLAKIEANHEAYKKANKPCHQLLVIDDMGDSLRNPTSSACLNQILFKYRHYNLTVIICVQRYRSLLKQHRSKLTDVVLFSPPQSDRPVIYQELMCELSKATFAQILSLCFQNRFNRMHLDMMNQLLYKNNQKINLLSDI